MRRSKAASLAAALLALALCACGAHPSQHHSSHGTTPPTGCQFTADTVTPRHFPLIQVQPPGSSVTQTISTTEPVPCNTVVSVSEYGTADLKFGRQAACLLQQYDPAAGNVAKIDSRNPLTTFFRMSAGEVSCIMLATRQRVDLCGIGALLLNGTPVQVQATCEDPVFHVAVLAGSLTVIDPSGSRTVVEAGTELIFDFRRNQAATQLVLFSSSDAEVFAGLADELGQDVVQAQQAISFTSTPPTSPSAGSMYSVTATGGGSGNTVIFSLDPASKGVCSVSGSTVTFTGTGTCTIDANQAGNRLFLPAPQMQQSVTVPPHLT
jgi:hypothetical protein